MAEHHHLPAEGEPVRSVYIHVPFCRHRCGYCNFTLVANRDELIEAYLTAVKQEIASVDSSEVDTIYLGGGTPSHLSISQWQNLVSTIDEKFVRSSETEFTVEANPQDMTEEKAKCLADLGVNRISLGVQSFSQSKLILLERDHDRESAMKAIDVCRRWLGNVGVDLIIGTPGESEQDWRTDLRTAIQQRPDHLSTYSLTFEKGTPFWTRRLHGQMEELPESAGALYYETAIDKISAAGYEHYEVSNFALPGKRSRHNQIYWTGQSYYGFGPGAAGYLNGVRHMNHRSTTTYLKKMAAGQSPVSEFEKIDAEESARERLIFGLRRLQGVNFDEFRFQTGFDIMTLAGPKIDKLLETGFLKSESGTIRLTRRGLLVSDSIWPELL